MQSRLLLLSTAALGALLASSDAHASGDLSIWHLDAGKPKAAPSKPAAVSKPAASKPAPHVVPPKPAVLAAPKPAPAPAVKQAAVTPPPAPTPPKPAAQPTSLEPAAAKPAVSAEPAAKPAAPAVMPKLPSIVTIPLAPELTPPSASKAPPPAVTETKPAQPPEQKIARATPPAPPTPPAIAPTPPSKPGLPTSDVRPPQYVLLAFDGSQSAEMWRQTMSLADDLAKGGYPAKFTYFISGVYFLTEKNRKFYDAPHYGPGKSFIGFGSSKNNDIPERIDLVNKAHAAGHEIASHANGHFNGNNWSEAQWQSEFRQFNSLVFDAAKNNELPVDAATGQAPKLNFNARSVVGFRAPMLGHSPGLWNAMATHGFRYDTSRTNKADYWPKKMPLSGWNFPLGEIKVPGTAMRTLSMDYNFYVVQSGGKPNATQSQRYEEQMLQAYYGYFNANYLGNRAPVHIGHHFTQWNGGAYWRAFQRFAKSVCGKPEVKCITYRELADELDKQTPETIAAWQRGGFPKLQGSAGIQVTAAPALDFTLALAPIGTNGALNLAASGPDWNAAAYRIVFEIDGAAQPASLRPTLAAVRSTVGAVPDATFGWRVYKGSDEVAWLTHRISMPGTAREAISAESLESAALKGEPAAAHHDDCDHPHTF